MDKIREDIKALEESIAMLKTMTEEYREATWDVKRNYLLTEMFCQHEIVRLRMKEVESDIDDFMRPTTALIINEEKSKGGEG